MRNIVINGVHLSVGTLLDFAAEHISAVALEPIGHGTYVYGLRTKSDWIKVSGLGERGEVDTAIDQRLLPADREKAREICDWCVTFYGPKSGINGEWVDLRTQRSRIFTAVMAEVTKS